MLSLLGQMHTGTKRSLPREPVSVVELRVQPEEEGGAPALHLVFEAPVETTRRSTSSCLVRHISDAIGHIIWSVQYFHTCRLQYTVTCRTVDCRWWPCALNARTIDTHIRNDIAFMSYGYGAPYPYGTHDMYEYMIWHTENDGKLDEERLCNICKQTCMHLASRARGGHSLAFAVNACELGFTE